MQITGQTVRLRDGFGITRVIKGGYQLARQYANRVGPENVEDDLGGMQAAVEAGIRTFDCGDIYLGVEEKIGEFLRRRRRQGLADDVVVLTKFVPDVADLRNVDFRFTENIVERSRTRLGLERIPMVQFHWWDYEVPGWMDVLGHLVKLKERGSIEQIGLTNFSARRTREILEAGFPIASTQVQYSLLDRRPGGELAKVCTQYGVGLLCYGTLCGSFLTDRWLGKPAPERPFREKYSRIIDSAGGWELLQQLLQVLHAVALARGSSIASIATRYVLQQEAVAGAIVGAHSTPQIAEARAAMSLELAPAEMAAIEAVLARARPLEGDVFELERDLSGVHGSIYVSRRSRHSEER
ncbi:MAG: aldo/keto reductase [Steroidobacteraceae bacterium]